MPKTLMLLGGSRHQVPAIEAAKRIGYRTVLCDYLPDNPGQYVADTFYQTSTTERELILDIAQKEKIDGIISFGSDVAAPTAAYVSENLGLATNPLEAVETLSEKHLYRPYLEEHGFNTPISRSFPCNTTPRELEAIFRNANMHLPIVLKPTDSSGSRGVTVLETIDTASLSAALTYAAGFSRNGILVAEEYIEYEFPHLIGGDLFVVDGQVRFWGLMRCLRDTDVASLVPVGKAYPCGLSKIQLDAVKNEIQSLITSLGIRFGEMNVEVIISANNRPYILELGARAGGNMIPLQLQDISGIDLVEASVRCAMSDFSMDVSFDGGDTCVATSVLHAREDGTFVKVNYAPEIAKQVYREMIYVSPGDHVERLTYGSKALGLVFMRFDSRNEMLSILDRLSSLITVDIDPAHAR